jgi:protein-disulfide isomerase
VKGGKARAGPRKAAVKSGSRAAFYGILGGIVGVAVIAIVWQMLRPTSSGVVTIDPNTPLPEATGYLMGSATAPVQVLEFADFECPACGSFATLTEPDMRKRLVETGTISFRFLDYPLPIHLNTWDASMAAACANEQGKFWDMHDRIFATQDQWSTEATGRPKAVFSRLAGEIGLDAAQWNDCYDTQKYKLNIAANLKEGERRLVQSTPTFIVGDKMIPGALGYDQLKAYVDSAMAKRPPGATPMLGDTAVRRAVPPAGGRVP